MKSSDYFPDTYFQRQDESEDGTFYRSPRLTVHIDDTAIAAAESLYGEVLPKGGEMLDLMSSWRSHLPSTLAPASVMGLGMNTVELVENPQLTDYVVHNLNIDPHLPFDDARFDGAVCTVSVQYLTHPVEVFAEVGRVLRAGAPFIVTFSNRCFPTKAVRVWTATSDKQHMELVERYFQYAGCFDQIRAVNRSAKRGWADPLYAVIGHRSKAV